MIVENLYYIMIINQLDINKDIKQDIKLNFILFYDISLISNIKFKM
jgi:hypothetical protein